MVLYDEGPEYFSESDQSKDQDYFHVQNPTERNEIHQASLRQMLLYCAPRMATSMAWSAQWAAFGPLLSTIFDASWKVQLIQIIGPVTGLIVAPAIGYLSDQCASDYGRRRPFLLGGTIATVICWCIMMNSQDIGRVCGDTPTNQQYTAFISVICYIWMDVSVNVMQTSASLLVADCSGYKQVTGASLASGYGTLGSLMVSGYIWIFGAAHKSIQWFFVMLIVILLVIVLPVCAFVTEIPLSQDVLSSRRYFNAIFAFYKGVRYLPHQLAIYCIIFIFIEFGYISYNGVKGQYFGEYVYGGDSLNANTCQGNCTDGQHRYNNGVKIAGGVTDTAFNLLSLVYLILLPYLVSKFGARRIMLWSIIPQILLIVMALSHIVHLNIVLVIMCAITQQTIYSLQIPVIMHVIGYGEQDGLGIFVGAFNSANCLGQLLNFSLSSVLVHTSMGSSLPVLLGGILSFIGFIITMKHFTLRMNSY